MGGWLGIRYYKWWQTFYLKVGSGLLQRIATDIVKCDKFICKLREIITKCDDYYWKNRAIAHHDKSKNSVK